jgi:hypothetical protein
MGSRFHGCRPVVILSRKTAATLMNPPGTTIVDMVRILSLSLSAYLKYCIVIIDTVFALFYIDKNSQEIFYKSILMISIAMIEK